MPQFNLSYGQFKWVAEQIDPRCEPEIVMAVSKVECRRDPFYGDGFPAILFERHIFWRVAPRDNREAWSRTHPTICNRSVTPRGGYGNFADQRAKFNVAWSLDPESAMEACSWGAFQELGANYGDYGFENVGQFVDMMKDGLYGQSMIFIKSIRKRGLADDMVAKRYETIAFLYNGPAYRKFNYHGQIEAQYKVASNLKIDWHSIIAVPPSKGVSKKLSQFVSEGLPENLQSSELSSAEETKDSTGSSSLDQGGPHVLAKEKVVVEAEEKVGFLESFWKRIVSVLGLQTGMTALTDKAQQAQALGLSDKTWTTIFWLAIIAGVFYLLYFAYHYHQKKKRDSERTATLIKENSTVDNFIQVASTEDLDKYRQLGYKVITRG